MSSDDLFQKLYTDVIDRAIEAKVSRCRVMQTFMEAYQEHKKIHGSFKNHPEYGKVMSERYHFMHDRAVKYIEAHK